MSQDAMAGIDFNLSGVVETEGGCYAILVDEESSMYLPVECPPFNASVINLAMDEDVPFDLQTFGLYFTFCSMLKANGVSVTEAVITMGKNKGLICCLDMVQENELGLKVSKIPVTLPDAMVLCAIFGATVTAYGAIGTDFAFLIDKKIPKDNIFSFICDDIVKSEKLLSLRQAED